MASTYANRLLSQCIIERPHDTYERLRCLKTCPPGGLWRARLPDLSRATSSSVTLGKLSQYPQIKSDQTDNQTDGTTRRTDSTNGQKDSQKASVEIETRREHRVQRHAIPEASARSRTRDPHRSLAMTAKHTNPARTQAECYVGDTQHTT